MMVLIEVVDALCSLLALVVGLYALAQSQRCEAMLLRMRKPKPRAGVCEEVQ